MGIVGKLKQISVATLEVLRQNPPLVKLFRAAQYLPEAALWKQATFWTGDSAEQVKKQSQEEFEDFRWAKRYQREVLKQQFLIEWEVPELDLHKSWGDLTFFLAGYIPGSILSWAVPELECFRTPTQLGIFRKLLASQPFLEKDFLNFLAVEESAWDGLPLVNAIGAGAEIGYAKGYGPIRYLLVNEVEQVMNGLVKLSEKGLEKRFWREAEKETPCPYIDWSDKEDLLEYMIELYNATSSYYQDAVINQRAMLLYLT